MPAPYVPNWIQPADPAAMWARGTQLGLQMSEQKLRAQQAVQQQQARQEEGARQAQQMAMENEYKRESLRVKTQEQQQKAELEEKYFSQAAKLAADKAAAILGYQQAIEGGMDPTKAILKYAPGMGQATAEAAALRSQSAAEALKQREELQAELLKVRQEMQQKAQAFQKELTASKEEAINARQDKRLAASGERKISDKALTAAQDIIKDTLAGEYRSKFGLSKERQDRLAKSDPGFAEAKSQLAEARSIVQGYMRQEGAATRPVPAPQMPGPQIAPNATPQIPNAPQAPSTMFGGQGMMAMPPQAPPPMTPPAQPQIPSSLSASASPLPKQKSDLVVGSVYLTSKGPRVWNGEGFVLKQAVTPPETSHDETPDEDIPDAQ